MQNCPHGERKYITGTGAKGPWAGWFCPSPRGTPNQCPPVFEDKRKGTAPAPTAAPTSSQANVLLQQILTELKLIRGALDTNKPAVVSDEGPMKTEEVEW